MISYVEIDIIIKKQIFCSYKYPLVTIFWKRISTFWYHVWIISHKQQRNVNKHITIPIFVFFLLPNAIFQKKEIQTLNMFLKHNALLNFQWLFGFMWLSHSWIQLYASDLTHFWVWAKSIWDTNQNDYVNPSLAKMFSLLDRTRN